MMTNTSIITSLLLLSACSTGGIVGITETTPTTTSTTPTTETTGTTGTTETGTTETGMTTTETASTTETGTVTTVEPPPPEIDCANLATSVTPVGMNAPRAYHGIVFNVDGRLMGISDGMLWGAMSADKAEIIVPGVGSAEQMDWLHDGDLAYLSNSGMQRISSKDGARSSIASGFYGYGMITGPDGMVYVADYSKIIKVDPDTGAQENFLNGFPGSVSPKVVNFSPDYSKMYIGTISNQGVVYAVDLDKDLQPIGSHYEFATGAGTWHDGLAVDACGNLYLNDYDRSRLNRISPDGVVELFYQFSYSAYGHGLAWGNGIGSWPSDHVYLPQPYNSNKVLEIDIGVPSRLFNDGDYTTVW
jgi:sugar lactone lactonase YvrE